MIIFIEICTKNKMRRYLQTRSTVYKIVKKSARLIQMKKTIAEGDVLQADRAAISMEAIHEF